MVTGRRRSRLAVGVQGEPVKHFVAGTTARSAAALVGVNRHTATLFFLKLRELISARLEAAVPELLGGEIEIDKSYFGGVRKGKRGRGASGKVPVFGLLKRGGNVHAIIIPNARKDTLFPIIRQKIRADSVVYTDSFPAYDILDVSEFHHARINHRERFVDRQRHMRTSGISQTPSAPLQRHPPPALSPLPQGMRMALQLPASIALVGNLERLAQKSDNQPYLGQPQD
jgi:transposase